MPKKGPARIKVGLSRKLSYSEKKYFRDIIARGKFKTDKGEAKTMILVWEPWRWQGKGAYRADFKPLWARLSQNEQVYAESDQMSAERLFDEVRSLLEEHYVNVHPTAVKTLRELG